MPIIDYAQASTLAHRDAVSAACTTCRTALHGLLSAPRGALTDDEVRATVLNAVSALATVLDAEVPASAVDLLGPMVGTLRQAANRRAFRGLPSAEGMVEVSVAIDAISSAAIDAIARGA